MTPQERQLVAELFDRLATLEGGRRDRDAEQVIAEGLSRAPNAPYSLVQTVLVQDEALKRADTRIRELEANLGIEPPRDSGGGFLDNMRDTLWGRREPGRGSVPTVRSDGYGRDQNARDQGAPMGAPAGFQTGGQQGAPMQQAPMQQAPTQQSAFGGGSFLGTAAATAAGVIGGAMLMNSIQGMFNRPGSTGHSAFDQANASGSSNSPWGGSNASGGDLARDAGLNDIGSSRAASYDDGSQRSAGLLDNNNDSSDDVEVNDDSFDVGGSDFDTA